MATKNKDPFSIAAERPLSEVGKSEAALQFEEEAKKRSVLKAAERLGTTSDALEQEAKEKGVNVLDLIKDKEKGTPAPEKKPASTKLEEIQKKVQAESPATDRTADIEKIKADIKAGTYSVEEAAARAQGIPSKPATTIPAASIKDAVKKSGAELGVVESTVKKAIETAAKQGKSAGEVLEQTAKTVPDKKTKLALGLLGAGLIGVAGAKAASDSKKTVKSIVDQSTFRPTPEGTTPLAPTPTGQVEDVSKPAVKKQEPKKVIDEAEESTKKVDEYIINEVPRPNQSELKDVGQTLSDKLENAKIAYRKGVDNVMLMKAFEKIAEGIALWGAGAYGMKHGVDAVSGLKFSPIDWSDKMKALEKELDLAESEYTKGIELEEKKQKETADITEKGEKRAEKAIERAEKQKESGIKARIAEVESQIRNIEAARARGKDADYISTAATVGIPKETLTKATWMGLGGPAFNKDTAEAAFEKRQTELVKEKAELLKQLAGEETAPAATPTKGTRTFEQEARYQELLKKRGGK